MAHPEGAKVSDTIRESPLPAKRGEVVRTIVITDRVNLERLAKLLDQKAGGKPYSLRTDEELWKCCFDGAEDLNKELNSCYRRLPLLRRLLRWVKRI
jgi:hypothetical protein